MRYFFNFHKLKGVKGVKEVKGVKDKCFTS